MGGRLIAKRTYNTELITAVMTMPEMWETVAEDGAIAEEYVPNVDDECWIEMLADGELVGIYRIHAHNSVCAEIHAQILPHCRKEYGKESGETVLQWFFDNAPWYQKLVAQIPVTYPNVINFTKGQGFKEEGVNRSSYIKNGALVDQVLLGITRSEIAERLGV